MTLLACGKGAAGMGSGAALPRGARALWRGAPEFEGGHVQVEGKERPHTQAALRRARGNGPCTVCRKRHTAYAGEILPSQAGRVMAAAGLRRASPHPLKNLRFLRISQMPPVGLRGCADGLRNLQESI